MEIQNDGVGSSTAFVSQNPYMLGRLDDKGWESILTTKWIDIYVKTNTETSPIPKLCWHCCHEIHVKTLHMPTSYDDKKDRFTVCGQFCSWECINGYVRDRMSNHAAELRTINVRLYRKKLTGLKDRVVPAPPFMTLKAFGGHLTIDEFRKPSHNVEYNINYAKLTKMIPYQIFEYKHTPCDNKNFVNKQVSINASGENDYLKLRRPKPLAKEKGTLERSLGLNCFEKLLKTKQ